MEGKLQELTQKIYSEGVEKAKAEADTILADAKAQADKMLSDAKGQADKIIENAKSEADQLKSRVNGELKMAGDQAKTSLKQEIADILSLTALTPDIKSTTKNNDFIAGIIKEIISKWDMKKDQFDINIILPSDKKKELTDFFSSKAADLMKKGVELKFEDRMDGGFKISPSDNSFVLSFEDKDFVEFFKSFLRPKTKEILFPGE